MKDTRPPSIQFACPRCEEEFILALEGTAPDTRLVCPGCSFTFEGGAQPPRPGSPVERCWLCGGEEFYIQKDFNRNLGLIVALGSFAAIFGIMVFVDARIGIGLLFLLALLDLAAYRLLPDVTVCYLCHSIYRGLPLHPEHEGFYLGKEERFKKERRRWLEELGLAP